MILRRVQRGSSCVDPAYNPAIDAILASVSKGLGRGIVPDVDAFARDHPELMPDLGEHIRILQAFHVAEKNALQADGHGDIGLPDNEAEHLIERLEGYKPLEPIAHGGQGVVYKALQTATGRVVAIKTLRDDRLESEEFRRHFLNEIELTALLRHPNIVMVYDSGFIANRIYCVFEYIEGVPIDDHVLFHECTVSQIVTMMAKACSAVEYAHRKGILHRDLKPSNILVDASGEPCVLDFGFAKRYDEDSDKGDASYLASRGTMAGTLAYLSPERISSRFGDVDTRCDVYALTVVLYHLLTRAYPYDSQLSSPSVIHGILFDAPRGLNDAPKLSDAAGRHFDAELEAIVAKGLAKHAGDRYPSARALADDLTAYLGGEQLHALSHRGFYVLRKTMKRHRRAASVAIVITLLIGLFGGALLSTLTKLDETVVTWENRLSEEQTNSVTAIMEDHDQSVAEYVTRSNPTARRERVHATPDIFSAAIENLPETLIPSITEMDHPDRAESIGWLRDHSSDLDVLSSRLSREWYRYTRIGDGGFVLAIEFGAFGESIDAWKAFFARAHLRFQEGDDSGARSDLLAARRVAVDWDRDITFSLKSQSTTRRRQVFDLERSMLVQSLKSGHQLLEYATFVTEEPDFLTFTTAAKRYGLATAQAANWTYTVENSDTEPVVDATELADYLGHPAAATKYFESNPDGATVKRDEVYHVVEMFLNQAATWDQFTFAELVAEGTRWHEELDAALTDHPLRYVIPYVDGGYASRMIVRAECRAVTLVAYAAIYKQQYGAWPVQPIDCIPEGREDLLLDPVSGLPFDIAFENDRPTVRSAPIERFLGEETRLLKPARMTSDGDRILYF
jgi:serine/threonine protein kinase